MWMTQFIRECKNQLRDVYGLTPNRVADGEPCFSRVPNGLYPMVIDGKVYQVAVVEDRFHILDLKEPVAK